MLVCSGDGIFRWSKVPVVGGKSSGRFLVVLVFFHFDMRLDVKDVR